MFARRLQTRPEAGFGTMDMEICLDWFCMLQYAHYSGKPWMIFFSEMTHSPCPWTSSTSPLLPHLFCSMCLDPLTGCRGRPGHRIWSQCVLSFLALSFVPCVSDSTVTCRKHTTMDRIRVWHWRTLLLSCRFLVRRFLACHYSSLFLARLSLASKRWSSL